MANFCIKCGSRIEDNGGFCTSCGNQVNQSNTNNSANKKKIGYGKCLGFTILGALGIFIIAWFVRLIFSLTCNIGSNNCVDISTFWLTGFPILIIVFSPIIALIIYLIKNK